MNLSAKLLKKPVTIRRDTLKVNSSKSRAEKYDIPYQTLTNLYLRDCTTHQCLLDMRQRLGGPTRVCYGRGLTPRPSRCSLTRVRAGLGRPRRRNASTF